MAGLECKNVVHVQNAKTIFRKIIVIQHMVFGVR